MNDDASKDAAGTDDENELRPAPHRLAGKFLHVAGTFVFRTARGSKAGPDSYQDRLMDDASPVPGELCKAARALLSMSQSQLQELAGVSKKTINDFENGMILPKPSLVASVRTALESAGARFIAGSDFVGVTVVAKRDQVEARSRTPRLTGGKTPPKPGSRPRGRPPGPK